jgi:hypothetical protein
MNLFGFAHLGMAVVSTQGSARSGPGISQSRQAQSCLGDRSDAGRQGVRPVSALLAARSAFNTPTGLI